MPMVRMNGTGKARSAQRDRHRGAAEDDGGTGVLHRVPHRRLVRHVRQLPFLAPADDNEERVFDRDAAAIATVG